MKYGFLFATVIILGFGLGIIFFFDQQFYINHTNSLLRSNQSRLDLAATWLRDYEADHGEYPGNTGHLSAIEPVMEMYAKVLDTPDSPFYSQPDINSSIASLWGDPLIYENRRGQDPGVFSHSLADDSHHGYSVKVDDGIYVWSLGAHRMYQQNRTPRLLLLSGLLLVVAAWCYCMAKYLKSAFAVARQPFSRLARAMSTLVFALFFPISGMFLSVLITGFFIHTCYAMHVSRRLTPELRRDHLALMNKYHKQGIISNLAYGKIVQALAGEDRDSE